MRQPSVGYGTKGSRRHNLARSGRSRGAVRQTRLLGVSDVSDFLPFLVFLYGTFASFLIFRLGKNTELRAGEERVLVAAGWAMTALSLTLAAALILFALSQSIMPVA